MGRRNRPSAIEPEGKIGIPYESVGVLQRISARFSKGPHRADYSFRVQVPEGLLCGRWGDIVFVYEGVLVLSYCIPVSVHWVRDSRHTLPGSSSGRAHPQERAESNCRHQYQRLGWEHPPQEVEVKQEVRRGCYDDRRLLKTTNPQWVYHRGEIQGPPETENCPES